MCEFISEYEELELLSKRRMNKLPEEEEPELEKVEEKPLVASN
jgi:hypothetical protein